MLWLFFKTLLIIFSIGFLVLALSVIQYFRQRVKIRRKGLTSFDGIRVYRFAVARNLLDADAGNGRPSVESYVSNFYDTKNTRPISNNPILLKIDHFHWKQFPNGIFRFPFYIFEFSGFSLGNDDKKNDQNIVASADAKSNETDKKNGGFSKLLSSVRRSPAFANLASRVVRVLFTIFHLKFENVNVSIKSSFSLILPAALFERHRILFAADTRLKILQTSKIDRDDALKSETVASICLSQDTSFEWKYLQKKRDTLKLVFSEIEISFNVCSLLKRFKEELTDSESLFRKTGKSKPSPSSNSVIHLPVDLELSCPCIRLKGDILSSGAAADDDSIYSITNLSHDMLGWLKECLPSVNTQVMTYFKEIEALLLKRVHAGAPFAMQLSIYDWSTNISKGEKVREIPALLYPVSYHIKSRIDRVLLAFEESKNESLNVANTSSFELLGISYASFVSFRGVDWPQILDKILPDLPFIPSPLLFSALDLKFDHLYLMMFEDDIFQAISMLNFLALMLDMIKLVKNNQEAFVVNFMEAEKVSGKNPASLPAILGWPSNDRNQFFRGNSEDDEVYSMECGTWSLRSANIGLAINIDSPKLPRDGSSNGSGESMESSISDGQLFDGWMSLQVLKLDDIVGQISGKWLLSSAGNGDISVQHICQVPYVYAFISKFQSKYHLLNLSLDDSFEKNTSYVLLKSNLCLITTDICMMPVLEFSGSQLKHDSISSWSLGKEEELDHNNTVSDDTNSELRSRVEGRIPSSIIRDRYRSRKKRTKSVSEWLSDTSVMRWIRSPGKTSPESNERAKDKNSLVIRKNQDYNFFVEHCNAFILHDFVLKATTEIIPKCLKNNIITLSKDYIKSGSDLSLERVDRNFSMMIQKISILSICGKSLTVSEFESLLKTGDIYNELRIGNEFDAFFSNTSIFSATPALILDFASINFVKTSGGESSLRVLDVSLNSRIMSFSSYGGGLKTASQEHLCRFQDRAKSQTLFFSKIDFSEKNHTICHLPVGFKLEFSKSSGTLVISIGTIINCDTYSAVFNLTQYELLLLCGLAVFVSGNRETNNLKPSKKPESQSALNVQIKLKRILLDLELPRSEDSPYQYERMNFKMDNTKLVYEKGMTLSKFLLYIGNSVLNIKRLGQSSSKILDIKSLILSNVLPFSLHSSYKEDVLKSPYTGNTGKPNLISLERIKTLLESFMKDGIPPWSILDPNFAEYLSQNVKGSDIPLWKNDSMHALMRGSRFFRDPSEGDFYDDGNATLRDFKSLPSKEILLQIREFLAFAPYQEPIGFWTDSLSVMYKLTKRTMQRFLKLKQMSNSVYNAKEVPQDPVLHLFLADCKFQIEDNTFESRLSRIFRKGAEENSDRLIREEIFWSLAERYQDHGKKASSNSERRGRSDGDRLSNDLEFRERGSSKLSRTSALSRDGSAKARGGHSTQSGDCLNDEMEEDVEFSDSSDSSINAVEEVQKIYGKKVVIVDTNRSRIEGKPLISISRKPSYLIENDRLYEAFYMLQQKNASLLVTKMTEPYIAPNLFTMELSNVLYSICPAFKEQSVDMVKVMNYFDRKDTDVWNSKTISELSLLKGFYIKSLGNAFRMRLRDFPLPLVETGSFESEGFYLVTCSGDTYESEYPTSVILGNGNEVAEDGNVRLTLKRYCAPLKFYHSFTSQYYDPVKLVSGVAYDPVLSSVSASVTYLTKFGVDPSPVLPFWDKLRYMLHGLHSRLTMYGGMSIDLPYTRNPYDVSESLSLNSSKGFELAFGPEGDLNCLGDMAIVARTNSLPELSIGLYKQALAFLVSDQKYTKALFINELDSVIESLQFQRNSNNIEFTNNMLILFVPNFELTFRIDWECIGHPYAHYDVQSRSYHYHQNVSGVNSEIYDGFRNFRSQSFSIEISSRRMELFKNSFAKVMEDPRTEEHDRYSKFSLYPETLAWIGEYLNLWFSYRNVVNRGFVDFDMDGGAHFRKPFGRDPVANPNASSMSISQYPDSPKFFRYMTDLHLNWNILNLQLRYLAMDNVNDSFQGILVVTDRSVWTLHYNHYFLRGDVQDMSEWSVKFLEIDLRDSVSSILLPLSDEDIENSSQDLALEYHLPGVNVKKCLWSPRIMLYKTTGFYISGYDYRSTEASKATSPVSPSAQENGFFKLKLGAVEDALKKTIFDIQSIDPTESIQILEATKRKTTILMDKKNYLKNYLTYLEDFKSSNSRLGPLWVVKEADQKTPTYHYHIHSPNLWWSEEIRNSVFRLLFLMDQFQHHKFYLTLDAVKLVKDTILKFLGGEAGDFPRGSPVKSSVREKGSDQKKSPEEMGKLASFIVHDRTEIEITNAQCNLETPSSSSFQGSVLIASEKCKVIQVRYKEKFNRKGSIARRRDEAKIDGTQIFVCAFDTANQLEREDWPAFIPISFLLNYNTDSGLFQKISDRLKFRFSIEYANPLYQYGINGCGESGPSEDQNVVINSFDIDSPIIHLQCNSSHYCILFAVVTKLLVYREPAAKKELDSINAVFLASEFYDIEKTMKLLTRLQERVRSLNSSAKGDLIKIRDISKLESQRSSDPIIVLDGNDKTSLMQSWNQKTEAMRLAQQDIHIIMEALKLVSSSREKKLSKLIRSKISAMLNKIVWSVMQPMDKLLGQLVLSNFSLNWVNFEDDSGRLGISVSEVRITNASFSDSDKFYDVIGPLNVNPSGDIAMVSLECREAAPVGGIGIFEILDINLQPVRLQITRDFAGKLISFFYPSSTSGSKGEFLGTGSGTKEKSEVSSTNAGNSDGSGKIITPSYHSTNSIKSLADGTLSLKRRNPGGPSSINISSSGGGGGGFSLSKAREAIRYQKLQSAAEKEAKSNKSNLTMTSSKSLKNSPSLASINNAPDRQLQSESQGASDLDKMRNRASENYSFAFVRISGGVHCVSYKGKREKNLEDINDFSLRMPTLEYRNKTCSWLDLLMLIKKDSIKILLSHTGSLVKEKLMGFGSSRKATAIPGSPKKEPIEISVKKSADSFVLVDDGDSIAASEDLHTDSELSLNEAGGKSSARKKFRLPNPFKKNEETNG